MLPHKSLFAVASHDPTELGIQLAAAAKEHAIYFDDGMGVPVVLRAEDINQALRDDQTFSTRPFAMGLMKDALIASQGDAHTQMRKLYTQFFSPQKIRQYEQDIVVPAVATVLDQLENRPQPDLLDHFCMLVPQQVISALFGLPAERIAENDVLVRTMFHAIVKPFDEEAAAEGQRAYDAMSEELHQIAARELDNPSNTLLGEIAKALQEQGDATVEACERIVFTLILGSYETTIWGLASVMAGLLRYPDTMARVRGDLALLPQTIEEAWRWCGSSMGTIRFVEQNTELGGVPLETGTVVHLAFMAPHFEAETYPAPERFDIDRSAHTMIFGGGVHYCIGAPLARMESRVAIGELLTRFPALRADPDRDPPLFAPATRGSIAFGPDHLPVLLR